MSENICSKTYVDVAIITMKKSLMCFSSCENYIDNSDVLEISVCRGSHFYFYFRLLFQKIVLPLCIIEVQMFTSHVKLGCMDGQCYNNVTVDYALAIWLSLSRSCPQKDCLPNETFGIML